MNSEAESLSFGRYLKSKRLEREMPLKNIAERTRIGLNTLVLIENDDLGKLPAEVFTKGFIRAYAKTVGADGDEAVRRYLSDLRAFRDAERFESDLSKTTTRFWPRLMLALALLGCIIIGTVYLFADPRDELRLMKKSVPESPPKQDTVPPAAEKTETAPPVEIVSGKKYHLKVAAVTSTWMKVIIDGQDTEEFKLSPGDLLELEATEGYNMLIGDAKGVELLLNEKPYPIPGKSGQVVTIQIP